MQGFENAALFSAIIALGGFFFALSRIKGFFIGPLEDRVARLEAAQESDRAMIAKRIDEVIEVIRAGHEASRDAHEDLRKSMAQGFQDAASGESGKREKIHDQLRDHARRIATLEGSK